MTDDFLADILAIVEEHGGLENLVEIGTVMDDGETIITSVADVAKGTAAFGDNPESARESTFTFRTGNRATIQWGE